MKQEGEFTEIITHQNIQRIINLELENFYTLPRLMWHIVTLQGLFERLRLANAFLSHSGLVYNVCIQPWPIQLLGGGGVMLKFCG